MEYVNETTRFIEKQMAYPLANPYIMAILKITLAVYAGQIAPVAPVYLQNLFKNTFFKIFAIALIVYLAEKDLQLALLMAIIYVAGMNVLAGRSFMESFADFSPDYTNVNHFTILEPQTEIYPGCENVTMDDLRKLFDGDVSKLGDTVNASFQSLISQMNDSHEKEKVMKIAYAAGLPYNLSFDNPDTAKYIATLLVNYGMNIKDSCKPPQ